jgi:hypothetical protein
MSSSKGGGIQDMQQVQGNFCDRLPPEADRLRNSFPAAVLLPINKCRFQLRPRILFPLTILCTKKRRKGKKGSGGGGMSTETQYMVRGGTKRMGGSGVCFMSTGKDFSRGFDVHSTKFYNNVSGGLVWSDVSIHNWQGYM